MFIAFEGIDGSGKSTAIKATAENLRALGHSVVLTREPGGSMLAEKIRGLILDPANDIDRDTEFLLFMAARCDHIKAIKHNESHGFIVLCDRFVDSTLAYQSTSINDMWDMQELIANFSWMYYPDYTFYLRVDPEIALERIAKRGDSPDRIEQSLLARMSNMTAVYDELVENCDANYYIIDANKSEDDVANQIINCLKAEQCV